jgi:hypothetical protein
MKPRPAVSLTLFLALAGCGRGLATHQTPAPDPAASRMQAKAWLRTARFEDADRLIACQPDCREQERGFDYARKGGIEQPGDCDLARTQAHASEDFIEGCRAYGQYLEAAGRGR